MNLPQELWNWLLELEILEEGDVKTKTKEGVTLEATATTSLLNGTKVSVLLCSLGERKGIESNFSVVNRPNSSAFSEAAFRVYNWANISEDLAKHDITLSADMRALITAGDFGVLCDLLSSIHTSSKSTDITSIPTLSATLAEYLGTDQEMPQVEPVVEVKTEIATKPLTQSRAIVSFAERLNETMKQHLKVEESEYIHLFENPTVTLKPMIVSGIDGDQAPIESWLKSVYMILELFPFEEASYSIQFLEFINVCFDSPSLEVVRWVCRILNNFRIAPSVESDAYQWFVRSCFKKVISAVILPHQEHVSYLTATFMHFGQGKTTHLLQDELPKQSRSVTDSIRFMSKIASHMRNNFSDELQMQDTVQSLLKIGQSYASEAKKEVDVQEALQFLCHVWTEYPNHVSKLEKEGENIIQELRKKCRQQSSSTKMCCILCMFRLLEVLMTRKNHLAPQIYKCLVFLLIESNGEQQIRDIITANFTQVMKKLPSIPPQVVIEPLVREISLEGYSNLDLEFIASVASHPRLPEKHALLLTHMLGKIALNDPVFARLAMMPFLTIIARFHTKPLMQDYIEKYCKVAVSMFLKAIERSYTSSGLEDVLDTNKIREKLSLEIVQKISQLKIIIYAQRMLPAVQIVSDEYFRVYNQQHPILIDILQTLQGQIQNAAPLGILAQFPDSMAHPSNVNIIPPPVVVQPVSRGPSKAEEKARRILNETVIVETPEVEPHLMRPAEEEELKLQSLTQQHEEQIRKLHEKEDQILREQEYQLAEERKKESEIAERRREQKRLEEEKYESMQFMTGSPEYVSPRRKRPAKLISARSSSRGSQPQYATRKKSSRTRNEKYKFLYPWPPKVEHLIKVTYERPMSRIFKMFKGKKPRTQKMRSFDELALAKECLGTADFLNLFETFAVMPNLIAKSDLLHICKEVSTCGGRLISSSEFSVAIWYVALWIYRDEHNPVKKTEKLINHMKEETLYNTKLDKRIWILQKKRRKVRKAPSLSPPRSPTSPYSLSAAGNRAQRQREKQRREEAKIKAKREEKRRKRDAFVKAQLKQEKESYELRKREQLRLQKEAMEKQELAKRNKEKQRQRRHKELKKKLRLHEEDQGLRNFNEF